MTGLLSDAEARAQLRRTRTQAEALRDLLRDSLDRAAACPPGPEALRWLGRARRIAPRDGGVALRLAGALLGLGRADEAAPLFAEVARRFGTPEAWIGLATARLLTGEHDAARAALGRALRLSVVTDALRTLAGRLAGPAGWCGIAGERLVTATPPLRVTLDGVPARLMRGRLPAGWRAASLIAVEGPCGPMLGSPLAPRAFAPESFVAATPQGGIAGWAWFPADPGRLPRIEVVGPSGRLRLVAREPAADVPAAGPLFRPRRFGASAEVLAALGLPLEVRAEGGGAATGSPLDPGIEMRAARDPQGADFVPVWADRVPARPSACVPPRASADIVMPIHGGGAVALAGLASALAALPRGSRLIVVDDASPDPGFAAALDRFARASRRVRLLRLERNLGYPGACNAGIAAAGPRDIVLLNSDTLVAPGLLAALAAAAYGAADIASVTPLTNEGTLASYPDPRGGNPMPDQAGTIAADALARAVHGAAAVAVPVGVGFCLYLRRDALAEVGMMRTDLFAQGYGEETDWCLRARAHGWRHVVALGAYVAHRGGASFGPARQHLMARNAGLIERLHPGYEALIAAHATADPLQAGRRMLDEARLLAEGGGRSVLLLTHAMGGGVERQVRASADRLVLRGRRPLLLRPARTPGGEVALRVEPLTGGYPNLVYRLPQEEAGLQRLLRATCPERLDVHHGLGHHERALSLAARLRIPQHSVIHDYARLCGRIALVGPGNRYCGEPGLAACEACIADLGSLLEDDPPVRLQRARAERELAGSVRVIAPSADAAQRLRRHFPAARPEIEPWEDDARLAPRIQPPPGPLVRVAVPGAIGIEKGFEVLLACARDAALRGLGIEFVVAGFTADDARLLAAGPVFITGRYEEEEAVSLLAGLRADLAFVPSIWPETWCFALTRAWQAGLDAAVFDLGAQAERVRRTGRGWVLPLGLGAGALNDALFRCASLARAGLACNLPRQQG